MPTLINTKHIALFYFLKYLLISILLVIVFVALLGGILLYSASIYWVLSIILFVLFWIALVFFAFKIIKSIVPKQAVFIIFFIALLLRIIWVALVNNNLVSDFAIYHELAISLAQGHGYAITGPVGMEDINSYIGGPRSLPYTTAYRAPGVPFWGATLYRFFGTNPITFKISNIILGTGSVLLIFFILQPSYGIRNALMASFVAAVYPSFIMATNLFGTETLFSFFTLLIAVGLSILGNSKQWVKLSALIGIVTAFAVLIRSMLWPTVISISMAILLSEEFKRVALKFTVIILFLILGVTPWALRNWKVFHGFIPVCTNEGIFLAHNSLRNVPKNLLSEEYKKTYEEWNITTNEAEKAKKGYKLGIFNLKLMLQGGVVHVLRCISSGFWDIFQDDTEVFRWAQTKFFNQAGNPDEPDVFSKAATVQWHALITSIYLLILVAALIGTICLNPVHLMQNSGALYFVISFVLFLFSHVILRGQPRYHFSMMPFLIGLSALGLMEIFNRLDRYLIFQGRRK